MERFGRKHPEEEKSEAADLAERVDALERRLDNIVSTLRGALLIHFEGEQQ